MKKIFTITLLFMLIFSFSIFGTTYNLKSGGGTGINWDSKGSWTPSGIPTALDTVILASSNSVIIDADAVCATIIIEAGYSGSITFAGAFTLTVGGDWTNSGAPSFGSGAIHIGGNFTNNNDTLDVIASEFTFNGSGDQTIYSVSTPVPATTTFGSLVIDKTGGTIQLLSDLAVENTFTETSGILDENGYSIWVNGAPLPVELSFFTADIIENRVKLKWRTETEVNNYGFEIERAFSNSENLTWEKIGFVVGHGNSYSPKEYEFIDEDVPSEELEYRLMQIDTDGAFEYFHITATVDASTVTDVEDNSLPTEFALEQNYPNPFNPSTRINFVLANSGLVNVSVYNAIGQKVSELVNSNMNAGTHNVEFNGSNLSSGFYFYRLETANFTQTMKMLLIK